MRKTECEREQDVLDVITAGNWPDKANEDLANHVSSCDICKDLSMVAHAFAEDYEAALKQVRLPSSGLVWWRAEIRSRQEAIRAVSRPITVIQGIAGAVGIIAVIGLLSGIDLTAIRSMDTAGLRAFWVESPFPFHLLLLAVAIVLILAPIALYFALSDD